MAGLGRKWPPTALLWLASAWLGFGIGVGGEAQTIERSRTITGPRGRTIERHVRSERAPGMIDREVQIRRPGGTLDRRVHVQRGVAPTFAAPPRGYGRNVFIERPVIVERDVVVPPPVALGLPFFSFFLGSPPPPPPVVVAPEPVYVPAPQAPVVVYQQPQPYQATAPATPSPVVYDPVADALGRLNSHHDNSRRDGALTLGRFRDARAVEPLIGLLENDNDREVRVAAAWALGEIGDPNAATPLQRAALFDHKREVREAASRAYSRLPTEAELAAARAAAEAEAQAAPLPSQADLPDEPDDSSFQEITPPPPVPAEELPPLRSGPGFPDQG